MPYWILLFVLSITMFVCAYSWLLAVFPCEGCPYLHGSVEDRIALLGISVLSGLLSFDFA